MERQFPNVVGTEVMANVIIRIAVIPARIVGILRNKRTRCTCAVENVRKRVQSGIGSHVQRVAVDVIDLHHASGELMPERSLKAVVIGNRFRCQNRDRTKAGIRRSRWQAGKSRRKRVCRTIAIQLVDAMVSNIIYADRRMLSEALFDFKIPLLILRNLGVGLCAENRRMREGWRSRLDLSKRLSAGESMNQRRI